MSLSQTSRIKVGIILFYIAYIIELIIMIIEKSELSFSYESYVFRFTFLLTFLSVLIAPHTKKEYILIVLIWFFTAYCYKISGKNDLLRIATFVIAAAYTNKQETLKYAFRLICAGFSIIVVSSILGICGNVSLTNDFGRSIGEETRYVFGFGHPNTLFSSVYMLFLMWICLYANSAKLYQYVVALLGTTIISIITKSRTGFIIILITFTLVILAKLFPKIQTSLLVYLSMIIISPIMCVIASILAAWGSGLAYAETLKPSISHFYWFLDEHLNYRMSSLYYDAPNHGGVISSWKLFASHNSDAYFDMGWVRIFYWYGIIPAIVIISFILLFCYLCFKQKDIFTMIVIFSIGIYTLVEATFVSRYIGRNILLPIFAVYIGTYVRTRLNNSAQT